MTTAPAVDRERPVEHRYDRSLAAALQADARGVNAAARATLPERARRCTNIPRVAGRTARTARRRVPKSPRRSSLSNPTQGTPIARHESGPTAVRGQPRRCAISGDVRYGTALEQRQPPTRAVATWRNQATTGPGR